MGSSVKSRTQAHIGLPEAHGRNTLTLLYAASVKW